MEILEKIDSYLNESSETFDIGNGWTITKTKNFGGSSTYMFSSKDSSAYRGEIYIDGAQDSSKKTITVRALGVYTKLTSKEKKELKPGLEKWSKQFEKIWNKPVKLQIP